MENKKEYCKDYSCYMFACGNMNILVEAEDKTKAIEVFKYKYKTLFNDDWKIFKVQTLINMEYDKIHYL